MRGTLIRNNPAERKEFKSQAMLCAERTQRAGSRLPEGRRSRPKAATYVNDEQIRVSDSYLEGTIEAERAVDGNPCENEVLSIWQHCQR